MTRGLRVTRALALALAGALASASACAASVQALPRDASVAAIHVSLHDVRAGGLAVVLAELLGRSVVVGGYVGERASVEGDFTDADAVLARVADTLHARTERVGDILVLRAPCVVPVGPAFNPFSQSPAGLAFSAVDPVDVLEILDSMGPRPVLHDGPGQGTGGNQPLALRVEPRTPVAATYEAIARATGTQVVESAPGHVGVRVAAPCSKAPVETFAPQPAGLPAGRPCPRVDGQPAPTPQSPCGKTEWTPLSDIRFKGVVRRGDHRWSVVEMSDGLTWSMTPGENVGIGYRMLQEIGDHGVVLRDMLPDNAGGWQEHVVRIAY